MSRRAARQPRPNGVSPYSARTRRRLLRDVEGLELLGGHHHAGPGERLAVQRGLDAAASGPGRRPARRRPGRAAGRRRAGRATEAVTSGRRPLRVADLEGVVLAAEEPASARPLAGQDRDVPGDVRPADGQLVAADRADRRMLDRRVGAIARLHQVRPALVVPLLAHERADQGDRAHLLGQPLEPLGELDPLERPSRSPSSRRRSSVPGCGSNVSSWLGPPASQSRITDCAGSRDRSACRPAAARRASASSSPASARKPRRSIAGR